MRKKRIFSFILQMVFLIAVLGPMSAWAGIAGDVDSSGAVDLKDAVLSLQVCAGMEPAGITLDADVNQDQKIGLEEAIYILGYVSDEGTLKYIGDLGEPDDYSDSLVSFEDSFPDTAGGFENFVAQLPEAFDWRDYNAVTRSKDQGYDRIRSSLYSKKRENQGYCGSCWAFASVAAFESKILIAGGPEYNLSEQQQVTCNTENFGCCGGFISAATFWENHGPMPESCTDYEDFYTRNTSCGCSNFPPYKHCSRVLCNNINTCEELPYRVNNYHSVNISSANEAKISIKHYGPGVFRYDIYDDFYTFWDNGSSGQVYVQSGSTKLGGHAVAIIGYDDRKGAWLCKNSWGENGPNGDGTFWIAYSGHRNDLRFRMSNFSITGVQACEYSIYPSGQSFSSSGGTGSIGVTATNGCTWTATSNVSWITITSGSSGTANGTVYYSVASNTGTVSRTGTITATGKTFTVTQSGLSCSYTISPATRSFDAGGGTGNVSVTATSGCQWTASVSASWINVVSGSSKTGDGTVIYQVAANTGTSSRTGTITIAGKVFTVTQSGTPCSYTISPTTQSFTSSSGNSTVSVITSNGCTWTAASNASWITITSGSNGTGSGTISYSIGANLTINSRVGTITAAGRTFTITQSGQTCSYSISPVNNFYSLSGGSGSIIITAPAGCSWTVIENLDWVTISAGESGNGNGTVSYVVSENTGKDSRTGTITIGGKTFSIIQSGSSDSNTYSIPDSGQTRCYDTDGIEINCSGTGQDGEYFINQVSYKKLDENGSELPDTADSWAMVKDNVTGLIWEVKEAYNSLRNYINPNDPDNTYDWYDPDYTTNGGYPGFDRSGDDTFDFITKLNNANYGGYSDWRMPTREELHTIVNYGKYNPAIDIKYFPYIFNSSYWSSSSSAFQSQYAWHVNFSNGYDGTGNVPSYNKGCSRYARAVRGKQTRSFDNWIVNGDGTVTDPQTGLMWEIKTDDGGNQDKDNKYSWQEALDYCNNLDIAGYSDWRLPSINELASLVDLSKRDPAINTAYFPKTVASFYWSSSSCAHPTYEAWTIKFEEGHTVNNTKTSKYYVRAVRGGQTCSYSISPLSKSYDLSGGTGSIIVTVSNGCSWTTEESLDWVTITAGESGNGNGRVSYMVSENTGADSRTGTITIGGRAFTITQNGSPSLYTHPIPDTGQARCYDSDGIEIDCSGTGQDGEYSINHVSYKKLDKNGSELPDTADSWAMVKDNVTGLIWEVKGAYNSASDYTNPNDPDNKYDWYDPDPATNGGYPGFDRSRDDTFDFITKLNNANYGGYSDWRMPAREELHTIVNYGKYNPAIVIKYFPYTFNASYWSSSSSAFQSQYAWHVNFSNGDDDTGNVPSYSKGCSRYVRAVRGKQTRSFDNWIVNGDGTVTDPQTGLMWEIKKDDGGNQDKDNKYSWQEALDYCNNLDIGGHSNWRLPNINELASLVDLLKYDPAINTAYFPKTISSFYWSSSSCAHPTYEAWTIKFNNGHTVNITKTSKYYVRAVRNCQ